MTFFSIFSISKRGDIIYRKYFEQPIDKDALRRQRIILTTGALIGIVLAVIVFIALLPFLMEP